MRELDKKIAAEKFLKLSGPILLSRVVSICSEFSVAIILAHVDDEHLAASAMINALQSLILRTGMNVLYPTSIIISRYKENSPEKVGEVLTASYLVALAAGAISMPLLWYSDLWLKEIGIPENAANLTGQFYKHALFGVPATLLTISSQQASYKLDFGWSAFSIGLLRRIIYVGLGYCLLRGELKLPKMGIAGLGLANACSVWIDQLIFSLFFRFKHHFKDFHLLFLKTFNADMLRYSKEIVSGGVVMGLEAIVDFVVNFSNLSMIGSRGTAALSAAEVAMQLHMILAIPITGLSQANAMIVRSEGDVQRKYTLGLFNTLFSFCFPFIFVTAFYAASKPLIQMFLSQEHHAAEHCALAEKMTMITLATIIPFHLQKMISGIYRGNEKYFPPFVVNFISTLLIGLGAAGLLNFCFKTSPESIFLSALGGQVIAAMMMTSIFYKKISLPPANPVAQPLIQERVDTRYGLFSSSQQDTSAANDVRSNESEQPRDGFVVNMPQ